jgi:hypothetical protein
MRSSWRLSSSALCWSSSVLSASFQRRCSSKATWRTRYNPATLLLIQKRRMKRRGWLRPTLSGASYQDSATRRWLWAAQDWDCWPSDGWATISRAGVDARRNQRRQRIRFHPQPSSYLAASITCWINCECLRASATEDMGVWFLLTLS